MTDHNARLQQLKTDEEAVMRHIHRLRAQQRAVSALQRLEASPVPVSMELLLTDAGNVNDIRTIANAALHLVLIDRQDELMVALMAKLEAIAQDASILYPDPLKTPPSVPPLLEEVHLWYVVTGEGFDEEPRFFRTVYRVHLVGKLARVSADMLVEVGEQVIAQGVKADDDVRITFYSGHHAPTPEQSSLCVDQSGDWSVDELGELFIIDGCLLEFNDPETNKNISLDVR